MRTHRDCAKVNMARHFQLSWWKHTFKAGRMSGYPLCCIFFFYVRSIYLDVYALIFNRNAFPIKWRAFYNDKERDDWENSKEFRMIPQHICCPYHKALHKLQKKEYIYHDCETCGWKQYEVKDCMNCAGGKPFSMVGGYQATK